MEARLTSNV